LFGAPKGLMTHGSLIDLIRGGVPALAALVIGAPAARIVRRRPALGRLSFARSLSVLTARVALFRMLALAEAPFLDPDLRFFTLVTLSDPAGRG
jgi:hypothetical protein